MTQFELLPVPPSERPSHQPWPYMPMVLTTSSSQEEGAERLWSILTKSFEGEDGRVKTLHTVEVAMEQGADGRTRFAEVPGTERAWPADLVLLAIGYVGPETDSVVGQLGLDLDERGNVRTNEQYETSRAGVFAAGDLRRGQSLVVWAISEGREAAREVDLYLEGVTALPSKGGGDLPRMR